MASSKLFSPNCSQKPAQLPPTVRSQYELTNPFQPGRTWEELQTPHRWTKPFGWASFIPKIPLWTIYPFDDLMTVPPLVRSLESGNYSLPERTIQNWTRLTVSLRSVIEKLGAVYHVPYVAPYPPRAWKYGEEGKHRQVLWWCHRSRDWFMVWSGLLAFQINVIQHQGKTQTSPLEADPRSLLPPHWKVTVRKLGFSEGFIDGLECLASDGIPRAGIVFDSPSQDPYFEGQHPNVSLWVQAGVPAWYRQHGDKPSLINPVLTSHTEIYPRPVAPPKTRDATQTALPVSTIVIQDSPTSPSQVPSGASSPFDYGSGFASPVVQGCDDMAGANAPKAIVQEYPSYHSQALSGADAPYNLGCSSTAAGERLDGMANTGELEYEDDGRRDASQPKTEPDDVYDPKLVEARIVFMRRQVQEMLQKEQSRIAKENAKETTARRNREREPATASAIVLEWDIDFDNLTEMKSRPVRQRERLDCLDYHNGKTRRYFPANNVWWCCDGIDIGDIDYYGTYEWHDERDDFSQPQSNEASDKTPVVGNSLQGKEMEDHPLDYYRQANDDYDPSVEIENVRAEIMEDLNILRGYVPPIELGDHDEYEKWDLSEGQLVVFARVLGFALRTPGVIEFLKTHLAFAIYQLHTAFSRSQTRSKHIKQVYDLEWECRQPLVREGYFQTLKVFTQCGTADNTEKRTRVYVFDRKQELSLSVASPVLALAVVRLSRALSSLDSIILRLLDLGVPFQVFGYRSHNIPRVRTTLLPLYIPSRPAGYKFSKEDYNMYRRNLDNLLASPRMRAALLRGGYIWRIASSCVSATEVLQGPSSEANVELRDPGTGGAFVGDELTREELAVIVGSYHCASTSNNQTELRSWWPPVHVYEDEKYGENLFRWTAWRERGYQDRLKEIATGTAMPLTTKEWRKKMKGRREWAAWRHILTNDANDYIEEHLPRASFVSVV